MWCSGQVVCRMCQHLQSHGIQMVLYSLVQTWRGTVADYDATREYIQIFVLITAYDDSDINSLQ